MLDQAAQRLQHSIDFDRADVEPLNALGDVLAARAELALTSAGAGGPAAQEAAGWYRQALDNGYMKALTINRSNAEALVRRAEAG